MPYTVKPIRAAADKTTPTSEDFALKLFTLLMESALHFLVFFAVGHHNTGCGTADESNAADGGDHQQNHLPPRDNVDNDGVTAQTVGRNRTAGSVHIGFGGTAQLLHNVAIATINGSGNGQRPVSPGSKQTKSTPAVIISI